MAREDILKIENHLQKKIRVEKFSLDLDFIGAGEKARLFQMMYTHGPGNGKMMLLPVDQGMEHGPVDFFPNPPSHDFEFQLSLAEEGNYSGIVCHIGLAEKHYKRYAGRIPLVLKINGKTQIPPGDTPLSPLDATVEDAIRLGACAIGYTLYVGSSRQDEDFIQFMKIRIEAKKYGMPVIVWAYPRGKAVDASGGHDSLAMVDYAARVANELGATLVKLNVPDDPKEGQYDPNGKYKKYNELLNLDMKGALYQVVQSAGRTGVLVSGGSKLSDQDLLDKVKASMEAGVDGLIFGRNMWQRKYDDALYMSKQILEILKNV
ncbi:MAG: fructose-bisphosphate aldolase [Atribacterota bacterium]